MLWSVLLLSAILLITFNLLAHHHYSLQAHGMPTSFSLSSHTVLWVKQLQTSTPLSHAILCAGLLCFAALHEKLLAFKGVKLQTIGASAQARG